MTNLKTKFKVDDYVLISKLRGTFDKSYQPNWSNEIFKIRKIQYTNPTTYLLRDMGNKNILGGFYAEQLENVKYPDVYLVEIVLKKSGDKMFVKCLGFDNKHNSWINKDAIV